MSLFTARKRTTRDNGDGLLIISFSASPQIVPPLVKAAPVRTPLRFAVATPDGTIGRSRALRWPITDLGTGDIAINVAVLPNSIPDTITYAPRDTELRINLSIDPTESANESWGISPDDRRKTLGRLIMLCKEPAFAQWLRDVRHAEPMAAAAEHHDLESAAAEAVLRLIHAHSRNEILNNAVVADRAERLVREYRRTRFVP